MFLLLSALLMVLLTGYLFIIQKETAQVCLGNNCFTVQIADNFITREIGLMFRKTLDQDEGMLFLFPKEDIYAFWMKNTLIPLDIIWVNGNKEIVFVNKNSQPCPKGYCSPITPDTKARYVLEIKAGEIDKSGLKIGDKIEINR